MIEDGTENQDTSELTEHANFAPATGDKVYTEAQAQDWFLTHASGAVICVRQFEGEAKPRERECRFFQEARDFYK